MAYTTANMNQVTRGIGSIPSLWMYTSTDIHTTVAGADYFSDGAAKGMKVGDVVIVSKSSATIGSTIHYVTTVTAGGAATIAAAILA